MLRRKQGATIAQIVEATGWQPHTVRGAFAGALKKKLGLTVTSEKVEGSERVYRIEALTTSEKADFLHETSGISVIGTTTSESLRRSYAGQYATNPRHLGRARN